MERGSNPNIIETFTATPLEDAKAKAKELRVGYDIREYEDGDVAVYTNEFKPFVFRLRKGVRMKPDKRQINKVWEAQNPIGQWFTYALIGSGKSFFVKTLHEGRATTDDYDSIGECWAFVGSKKQEREFIDWHKRNPIAIP